MPFCVLRCDHLKGCEEGFCTSELEKTYLTILGIFIKSCTLAISVVFLVRLVLQIVDKCRLVRWFDVLHNVFLV